MSFETSIFNPADLTPEPTEIARVAEKLLGVPDGLDEIDAVLVTLILGYVRSLPALGRVDTVALVAIIALSTHEPDNARQLMAELTARS